VFDHHGHYVDQEQIVERLYGSAICATAQGWQIINTINGTWTDDEGETFEAEGIPLVDADFNFAMPNAGALVAQEIANDNPVINGAVGHATVVVESHYHGWAGGAGTDAILVADPWPGNASPRFLTPYEMSGTFFIAKVEVH
jgi:hypothetical protein